jgi:hypothetical protein
VNSFAIALASAGLTNEFSHAKPGMLVEELNEALPYCTRSAQDCHI